MALACGIVGLPNVGKSTIFSALTSAKAAAANFPFCTIEPNTGAVPVPDPRLQVLASIEGSEKIIPTQVTFVDIAGLIKGASKGEGLGNQFLGHIRSVDAIVHVVRCFDDPNIIHVEGRVDPIADVETIDTELILSDLDSVAKQLQKIEKAARGGDKDAKAASEFANGLEQHLGAGKPARTFPLPDIRSQLIIDLWAQLLTAKPTLFVANVDESEAARAFVANGDRPMDKLYTYACGVGAQVVPIAGKVESEIAEIPQEERAVYLRDLGLEQSGLDRLCVAGYKLLNLITFFTVGPKEAHAWTAAAGTTAPGCAGKIHTDFERGFIRAEVVGYDDFVKAGSEVKAKEAGKLRVEGKEYVMQDGDIVHFRFNV